MPSADLQPALVEAERLSALESYHITDSGPERGFEDIAELASFVCSTPISLVSFVDRDRQWFKASLGMDAEETPRAGGFCAHTVSLGQTTIIPDARLDERFCRNPLVLGEPNIRFYAGAPIREKNGHVLGTVCVIDTEPRTLDARQTAALESLARQVVVLLEQRKAIQTLEATADDARIADRLVQDSEKRLQTFVNRLPALAWMANADGWIFWYNRRWYDYTGTTPEQMEGWGWKSVHDPSSLDAVMERWTGSIRTGEPFEMIFPLRGADGEFRPFLTRIEPLRDEDGKILQWFGTNIEVDALHKTQMALARSEEGLAQVMNATTDAVVSVNRRWIVTYLNPRAEELYRPARQLVGRNLWDAFPDTVYEGSPFVTHYHAAMDEGKASSFEAEYADPLNFTLGLEVYPTKDGIVVFSRDVTKLKHATAAVLQNEKLAAVGRLASSIAHEINNPLEAITNLMYLALNSSDLDEARPFLTSADLELRRVSAITQQTLRFHRQATGPTLATFDKLVSGILVGQHSRLTNAGCTVKQDDRTHRPVWCLEGEIRQVLVNLVGNAIDAMRGKGGTLSIRGRDGRNWKTGQPGMVLTIADTGTGIPEPARSRLFEAFYTTKGIAGTGLGLWISKEIVDRHHGTLRLRTRQGDHSGTIFSVFLPYDASDQTPGEDKFPSIQSAMPQQA